MSKKTAIQLLRESIDSEVKLGTKMVINWDMYLEMEREQIIDAVSRGWWNNENGLVSWIGEEYYNETYKTKDDE